MTIRKTATTLALLLFGTTPLFAQSDIVTSPKQTDAPEIPFTSVEFGQLPASLFLGEASSVAVNSKGHVFIFSRGNSTGPAYGAAASQLFLSCF